MRLGLAFFILLFQLNIFASNVIIVDNRTSQYDLSGYLNVEKIIIQGNDTTVVPLDVKGANISSSISRDTYRASFNLLNKQDNPASIYLKIDNPDLNIIKYYELENNDTLRSLVTGENYPFNTRDVYSNNFSFKINLAERAGKTIVVEVNVEGDFLSVPMKLLSERAFYKEEYNSNLFKAIIFGLQIVLGFLILMLFISMRERIYLYYTIYAFFSAITFGNMNGITVNLLWFGSGVLADITTIVTGTVAASMYLLFAQEFFSTKKYSLRLYYAGNGIAFLAMLLPIILVLFKGELRMLSYSVSTISVLVSLSFIVLQSIFLWKHNRNAIKVYAFSFSPIILAYVVYSLNFIGLFELGGLFQLVIFSVTLQQMLLALIVLNQLRKRQDRYIDNIRDKNNELRNLTAVTDESNNSIAIYKSNGEIHWTNKQFRLNYGSYLLFKKGNNISQIIPNPYIEQILDECKEKKQPVSFETEREMAHGGKRWIQTTITPIFDEKGKVMNLVSVDSDISKIKHSEQERKSLQEQLFHSQKLETVGILAGGIAHDFNNILSPIIGYTELLLEDVDDATIKDDLYTIHSASQRAKELVRKILTFSHYYKENYEHVNLSDIVDEVIGLLNSAVPSVIELETKKCKCDTFVYADSTQMHQVIMNICTNAYQAIGSFPGKIVIVLDTEELDRKDVKYSNNAGNKYVKLSISDNGPGMSEELINKIFDPFFTTKEVGKGTGLGLSVVHGIIKSSKGFIDVDSEIGVGTTFTIYLPLVMPEKTSKSNEFLEHRGNQEKILVLDDDHEIALLHKRILEKNNYNVEVFINSTTALSELKVNSHTYDLLLTDQTMQGMTGDMLAEKAKEMNCKLKVIIVSGYSELLTEERLNEVGIDLLMPKPVSPKNLCQAIYKVLNATN